MSINVKSVQGRRVLKFQSMEDIVKDAETLVASANTRVLGNWPLSQLLTHLAMTIESSIDGFAVQAPWFVRIIGPFLKNGMITKPMAPGLKLPKKAESGAFPTATSPHAGLERLKVAVGRTKNEVMSAPHPAFGKMTHDEWIQLHLRHSELHLSFATPG